jgi:hypothetical protein
MARKSAGMDPGFQEWGRSRRRVKTSLHTDIQAGRLMKGEEARLARPPPESVTDPARYG